MPTSSDHKTPSAPQPDWSELTATLPRKSTNEFSDWLSGELDLLEQKLDHYVTPNSLSKTLRSGR